jgi:hypothetical protein
MRAGVLTVSLYDVEVFQHKLIAFRRPSSNMREPQLGRGQLRI